MCGLASPVGFLSSSLHEGFISEFRSLLFFYFTEEPCGVWFLKYNTFRPVLCNLLSAGFLMRGKPHAIKNISVVSHDAVWLLNDQVVIHASERRRHWGQSPLPPGYLGMECCVIMKPWFASLWWQYCPENQPFWEERQYHRFRLLNSEQRLMGCWGRLLEC